MLKTKPTGSYVVYVRVWFADGGNCQKKEDYICTSKYLPYLSGRKLTTFDDDFQHK